MTKSKRQRLQLGGACGSLILVLSACGPRVLINTGTTIGLKATPGDAQTRPPQVTFGYKRAEVALLPTKGGKAQRCQGKRTNEICGTDAFSALAAIQFSTHWFGTTELRSFVGTGFAARDIIAQNVEFNAALATAALGEDELVVMRSDAVADIANAVLVAGVTDATKLEAFFTCVGKSPSITENLLKEYAGQSKASFVTAFKKDFGSKAPAYRDRCVK